VKWTWMGTRGFVDLWSGGVDRGVRQESMTVS
jgi:hypothetical protein